MGYRNEDCCIPGFNLAIIDCDGGIDIDTAKLLLSDYKFMMYTTKRHTDTEHRFRVIFPLSHTLKMAPAEYKEFMNNLYDFLPFEVDRQTNQRSRKWLSHKGQHWYNDGEVLDALLFIPKTRKAEERKRIINDQTSLTNLERWFINNTGLGNRSNQLIKYTLVLVDMGKDIDEIKRKVLSLNEKLPNPLEETEILSTHMMTAASAIHKRDTS